MLYVRVLSWFEASNAPQKRTVYILKMITSVGRCADDRVISDKQQISIGLPTMSQLQIRIFSEDRGQARKNSISWDDANEMWK